MSDGESLHVADAILDAASSMLREHPFDSLNYAELAQAASVSERTVYRRFPTRTHLLEALARWIGESLLPTPQFTTMAGFRLAARERFRTFDAYPAHAFVCARAAAVSPTGVSAPSALTTAIVEFVGAAAPTLNKRDAYRTIATLRYFASETFWARMRTGFDMDAEEIFDVSMRATRGMHGVLTRAHSDA